MARAKATNPTKNLEACIVDRRLERAAFGRAVHKALIRHKRAGIPIATWENGRVRIVPSDEIDVSDDQAGTIVK